MALLKPTNLKKYLWKELKDCRQFYNSFIYYDNYEAWLEKRKPRFQRLRGLWELAKAVFKTLVCYIKDHDLEDCSSAGPDSGNMDHQCKRCGRYWHVPLY